MINLNKYWIRAINEDAGVKYFIFSNYNIFKFRGFSS